MSQGAKRVHGIESSCEEHVSGYKMSGEKRRTKKQLRKSELRALGLSNATQRRIVQLHEFKSRHGHTWVAPDQSSKFYVKGLGGWVRAQRKAWRRGEISKQLHQALVNLGFSWQNRSRQPKELVAGGAAEEDAEEKAGQDEVDEDESEDGLRMLLYSDLLTYADVC